MSLKCHNYRFCFGYVDASKRRRLCDDCEAQEHESLEKFLGSAERFVSGQAGLTPAAPCSFKLGAECPDSDELWQAGRIAEWKQYPRARKKI